MIILGVDIGVTGGLAWIEDRQLIRIEPMPTVTITSGKTSRREVAPAQLIGLFHLSHHPDFAFLEEPVARPLFGRDKATGQRIRRSPGAMGMLALGDSFGTVRACCAAIGVSVRRVTPGAWKREMGLSADKDESRRLAQETWPGWAMHFALKKSDGLAEAALLALWGLDHLG